MNDRMGERLKNYEVGPGGCWLWLGYMDKNGYGRVAERGLRSHVWVHRASYEHFKGPIPDRYQIDHTCTVTRCMNPEHLDAVTAAEHTARTMRRLGKDDRHLLAARMRMIGATYTEIAEALELSSRPAAHLAVKAAIRKGLVEPDDVPPVPKLNEAEREEIRDLAALGIPQTVLAGVYKVDSSQISRICSGYSSGQDASKRGKSERGAA